MKGDISRSTFDADKHYTGVRMQQGRVLLDSEWNEQVDIAAYLDQTANIDVIGKSGVPRDGGGFAIVSVPGDLIITPGRMWVEGILCENEGGTFEEAALQGLDGVKLDAWPADASRYAKGLWLQIDGVKAAADTTVYRRIKSIDANGKIVKFTANVALDSVAQVRPVWSYATQPHDPKPAETANDANGDPALTINVDYVAYLDVWTRHLTAVEDESIREVALGGPDTTTRTQTIWQVRLDKTAKVCADIVSPVHTSRMLAQLAEVSDPPNPCIVPSQAGYRGLANQLYRVEIHTGSTPGPATFKWSRDNAAFVFPVESFVTAQPTQLRLESLGRDERFGLAANDWVELIDDSIELQGRPGLFGRVKATPQQNNRIIDLDTAPVVVDFTNPDPNVAHIDLKRNPRVRLWSHDPNTTPATGDTKITNAPTALESGIEVVFSGTNFRTGEYWLIPARTAINEETGDIEWPRFDDKAIPLPPRGITHHHAALADVTIATGKVEDCRPLFSPLTAPELFYLSGDGQEAMPDLVIKARKKLEYPLKVGVLNGGPIPNAEVEFEITAGDGRLANNQKIFKVITGADGVAETTWEVDATTPYQRCRARLLKANGYAPVPLPAIEFNAAISVASQVAYDPAKCEELKNRNAKTVQQALDAFCDILDDPKLYFVGGDGQETTRKSASPAELPETIDVGVADGIRPVGNQKVRFTPSHNGTINGVAAPVEVNTAPGSGIASVKWALDSAGPESQTATAELLIGGNPSGLPVVFKAMFREVAQGAGPCSIVIDAQDDVLARLAEVENEDDLEICFKTGVFKPAKPIELVDKNSVKVTGAGIGSHIVGPSEIVFAFLRCRSVILRDLFVEGVDGEMEVGDAPAVAFRQCGNITIDTLRVGCRKSVGARRAAIGIRRSTTFSIERCDLVAGEGSVGILLDEPDQAIIAENRIGGVRPQRFIVSRVRVVSAETAAVAGNIIVKLGNQRVSADVPREFEEELREVLRRADTPGITSERTAMAAFNKAVENVIADPAFRAEFPRLDRSIRRLELEGGRSAAAILARREDKTPLQIGSLTIRDNVIHDVLDGILAGDFFENQSLGDRVARAAISGNEISFDGEGASGISVPGCDNLHIFANVIEAEKLAQFGIRVRGNLGPFAMLRDNHTARCQSGINGSQLGAASVGRTWWAIANNVVGGTINLPQDFKRDKNEPAP